MNPITNQVIIKVEKQVEDSVKLGSKEIFLDGTFEPEKNARIYGTVIGIPENLSGIELYRNHRANAKKYISGEEVRTTLAEQPYLKGRYKYQCADYSPEEDVVYNDALPVEIQVGDKAYFHFNALKDSQLQKNEDGSTVHFVRYDQVFCVVRTIRKPYIAGVVDVCHNEIIPIGGHVLIEPYFGDDIEELQIDSSQFKGITTALPAFIKAKKGKFGIITDIHDKPVLYTGIVRYICKYAPGYNIDFKAGDKILYARHSDFDNVIEGKEYYVMKVWDITAKLEE